MCRVGLHCAPAAHRTLGTFPAGTVRFGLGAFSTAEEISASLTSTIGYITIRKLTEIRTRAIQNLIQAALSLPAEREAKLWVIKNR